MKKVRVLTFVLLATLAVVISSISVLRRVHRQEFFPPACEMQEVVTILAHPGLEGRESYTDSGDLAGLFLKRELERAGFQVFPAVRSWFQPIYPHEKIVGSKNSLLSITGDSEVIFSHLIDIPKYDFNALPQLGSGLASGKVVFVGYGITAPEYHYDDYASVDVRGKVVLMIRYEPRENSDDYKVFLGSMTTEYGMMTRKVENALKHGAVGVIFVNNPAVDFETAPITFGDRDDLPNDFSLSPEVVKPFIPLGIPVISVSNDFAEKLLDKPIDVLRQRIDLNVRPQSFLCAKSVSFSTAPEIVSRSANNVIGYLPRNVNSGPEEFVVISAHYDHLGVGPRGIFLGADDNASGCAAVLAIAQAFGKNGMRRERSVLVIFFTAEERGLVGSRFFTESKAMPEHVVAVLNFDMVGRNDPRQLFINAAPPGKPIVYNSLGYLLFEENNKLTQPFTIKSDDESWGRTDSYSFYEIEGGKPPVPSLHFFTGEHEDYHQPTDTADKINYEKLRRVSFLGYKVAARIVSTRVPVYFNLN